MGFIEAMALALVSFFLVLLAEDDDNNSLIYCYPAFKKHKIAVN